MRAFFALSYTERLRYVCGMTTERKTRKVNQETDKRLKKNRDSTDLDTCTVGAMRELHVAQDLLSRGMCVYRNVSPTGPCDLIALSGNRVWRVEVSSGCASQIRAGSRPRKFLQFSWPKKAEHYTYDVHAMVVLGEVFYNPPEFWNGNTEPVDGCVSFPVEQDPDDPAVLFLQGSKHFKRLDTFSFRGAVVHDCRRAA